MANSRRLPAPVRHAPRSAKVHHTFKEKKIKFRKKPIVIEAVQWNCIKDLARNCQDHPRVRNTTYKEVAQSLMTAGCSKEEPFWSWQVMGVIDTLEGPMFVCPGDWIITGVKGEVYSCKPDIFVATYEPVEE